jgi:hypothetical protein
VRNDYPKLPFRFPESTQMTMTTREVTIFLGEVGQIRELLGKIESRLTSLESSVLTCQTRCGDERDRRRTWIHYAGAILAALIPAGVVYFLQVHH